MSRTWKWILGILAGLIVVGLVGGAVFMWSNHTAWWGQRAVTFAAPNLPGWQERSVMPHGYDGYRRYHMDDWAGHMPMMGGGLPGPYAFSPFGMGCMIVVGLIRLAIPLGVLALVAYLFYQMGKRAGSASVRAAPSMPDVDALPRRRVARR
jgi:hypothetical protein